MPRLSLVVVGVVVTVVALAVPVQGAVAAPVPPSDSVVGGGDANGSFLRMSFDVHSDALGGNPSGVVSGTIVLGVPVQFTFPVSCLAVHKNRAVIGAGPLWLVVIDRVGTGGSRPDGFFATVGPTDCSSEPPFEFGGTLTSGDIVVRDAPSKDQCRDGGWRNYTDTDAAGQPFRNQGECIAFALGAA